MATVARIVCDMSWKDYLTEPEQSELACFEDMIAESVEGINRIRVEINTLRKRAGKRMERAAQKARKEDQ